LHKHRDLKGHKGHCGGNTSIPDLDKRFESLLGFFQVKYSGLHCREILENT
jgi:hypothetical protein